MNHKNIKQNLMCFSCSFFLVYQTLFPHVSQVFPCVFHVFLCFPYVSHVFHCFPMCSPCFPMFFSVFWRFFLAPVGPCAQMWRPVPALQRPARGAAGAGPCACWRTKRGRWCQKCKSVKHVIWLFNEYIMVNVNVGLITPPTRSDIPCKVFPSFSLNKRPLNHKILDMVWNL